MVWFLDSDEGRKAWDTIRDRYHKALDADADNIRDRILDGDITDDDGVTDAVSEEADNAVIYTLDAWLVCACSDNDDAYEDAIGDKPPTIETQACMAYAADLRDMLAGRGISVEELRTERAERVVKDMPRDRVEEILKDGSCWDDEDANASTPDLRAKIVECIEDNTLSLDDL